MSEDLPTYAGTSVSEETDTVRDENPHIWRTEIPNIFFEFGLDVYEFRLYAQLKRIASDYGVGRCGTRKLAEVCGMSVGKISEVKASLEKKDLIRIQKGDVKKGQSDSITIIDLWKTNYLRFVEIKRAKQTRSHSEHPPVHGVNTPVHVVNVRRTKYKKKENNPITPLQGESVAPELSFSEQYRNSPEANLDPVLNHPQFPEAWDRWCELKRERKKTLTKSQKQMTLTELAGWAKKHGIEKVIEQINEAVIRNWSRIFEPKLNGNTNGYSQHSNPSTSIQIEPAKFLAWQKTAFPDRTFYETPETAPLNMIEQFQEENKA